MKKNLLFVFLITFLFSGHSQSTLITPGVTQPSISATSTTNGVVIPRMTTIQKNSIVSVSAGTIVYDTNLSCLSLYTGNGWVCVNSPSSSLGPLFQNFQFITNPSGNAPLTGVINVTSDQPIKLSYTVKGQDGEDFTFSNDKFSVDNDSTINVYGLYPSFTNTVIVTITSQTGYITQKTMYVTTDSVPIELPQPSEIIVNSRSNNALTKFILCFPYKMTGTFVPIGRGGFITIIDTFGKIRWYLTLPFENNNIMIPLKNGNWLVPYKTNFKEIDLMGNIFKTTNLQFTYHHDVLQLPNNNLMYLGNSSLNNTIEDKIYTMDYLTGSIIDSLNLYTILDPTRPQLPQGPSNDWFHANSLTYNSTDNSILVSGRQQSAVVKIDLSTKQLKWILSDPTYWSPVLSPYLLTPTGLGFEQQWGQHSVVLKPNDSNTLILFDDGNDRSYTNPVLPINNYSRLVEYTINEASKTVSQNYQFGKEYGSLTYAPYVGKVEYLNNDRFFVGNGGIRKDANGNATGLGLSKNEIRFFEVDRGKQVYFDISIKTKYANNPQLVGFLSYRASCFNFK